MTESGPVRVETVVDGNGNAIATNRGDYGASFVMQDPELRRVCEDILIELRAISTTLREQGS